MRFLIAITAVAFLLGGCAGEPKHPTWNNATGAEQHERLMWQAIHDQDWTNFERRLAPAFAGVNAAGRVFDRAGWLEYWKSAHLREYSLGEVAVQPAGADMVVTYVLQMGPLSPAGPGNGLRVVSVWQEIKGRWTLIATSTTPIAPI